VALHNFTTINAALARGRAKLHERKTMERPR
jgi:hypothetical protein